MANLFEIIPLLSLCALAGLRLYATLFFLGLLSRSGGLGLVEVPASLALLGNLGVLTLLGILFLLEFLLDKIAYVDTLWDALHTLIRPPGALLLGALLVVGQAPMVVMTGLLISLALGLTAHAAKAAARFELHAGSPAAGAVAVSLAEEIFIAAALLAFLAHPALAALAAALVLAAGLRFARFIGQALRDALRRLLGRVPLERGPLPRLP